MFYWLNYAQNGSSTAPTVLWLQGGPGASSLFGSFIENGPVDVFGNRRNTSWTIAANMLFVDNPVRLCFACHSNRVADLHARAADWHGVFLLGQPAGGLCHDGPADC